MASVALKSILGGTVKQWRRTSSTTFINQASTFASSSRIGLDFTRPLRAAPPGPPLQSTVTTVDPVNLTEEPSTTLSDSPSTTPPPPSPSTTTSNRNQTSTPTFNLNTTTSPITTSKSKSSKLPRFNPEPIHLSTNDSQTAPTHTLTVTSTRNNCLLTFSDHTGPIIPTITSGSGKIFKKSQRSSYEAAHQATLKMMNEILGYAARFPSTQRLQLRVAFKGMFGQGRQAVSTAIGGPDGIELRRCIVSVEDRTPIKVGGTRARKARRV